MDNVEHSTPAVGPELTESGQSTDGGRIAREAPESTRPQTEEEILAALDPETRALAHRMTTMIRDLQEQVDELDQEYARGWVDGAAETAAALADRPSPGAVNRFAARMLRIGARAEERLTNLEATMKDVATAESIMRRVRSGEQS
jgi:hypothetical protein